MNISRRNILKLFGLAGASTALEAGNNAQAAGGFTVTLLHSNDTHDHLEPTVYSGKDAAGKDYKAEYGGVARIKTALETGQTKWSEELTRFARRLPRASTGRAGSAVALKSLSLRHVDAGQAQTLAASKQYDGKIVASEFTMNGEATSLSDVTRFIRDFETDPNFGIQAGAVTNNKTNNTYSFSATIGLVSENPAPAVVVAPATGTTPGAPAPGTPAPGATPAPAGGQ